MRASVVFVRDALDFKQSRVLRCVSESVSIREWLDREGIEEFRDWPTGCWYNGQLIGRSKWPETMIRDGDVVAFVSLPAGGGGQQKNPMQTVLLLAVLVASIYTAGALAPVYGQFVGALAGAGIGITGGFAVNALFGPGGPKSPKQPSPTYAFAPEGNKARLGETIPVVYGRLMVTPDYAEQPWSEYVGQVANPTKGDSNPAKQIATQYLYQLFCLTCGYADVEAVYVGDTNVRGFEEVEWEVYQPGEEIALIPKRVTTSDDVTGQELKGPNNPDFDPATPGDPPTGGQIRPYKAGTGISTDSGSPQEQDYYYTADGGGNTSTSVDGITVDVGYLDDTDLNFLTDPDLVSASLIGKQVYIGGAQQSDLDYENYDPSWQNAATGHQHYKIVHPDRLRTIVKVEATRIYVRPQWNATYTPADASYRKYHIRDDFVGPFIINAQGTVINGIGVDAGGPPLIGNTASGENYKLAVGLRFEIRELDSTTDAAVAGSTGEWQALGPEYTQKVSGTLTDIIGPKASAAIVIFNDSANDVPGAALGRRATFAIAGAGGGVQNIALSQLWNLSDLGLSNGRYEIRGRRTSHQKVNARHSDKIYWTGLKGLIHDTSRVYNGVTTLAIKSRVTGDLAALTNRQVRAIVTRNIDAYGGGNSATALGTDPLAIDDGSSIATVSATAHGLVTGQEFSLGGVTGTPGGISNLVWNHNVAPLYTVAEIVDPDTFTFELVIGATTYTATSQVDSGGGSSVTLTSTAGWYRGFNTNPAWPIADACRDTDYGLGLADAKIDIDALITLASTWDTGRGMDDDGNYLKDEFNAVFDSASVALEALNTIARAGRGRVIQPAGIVTPVRDEPRAVRSAFFSERNIVRDSFSIAYSFPREDSPDCVQIEYVDRDAWKPKLVPLTSELAAGAKPAIIKLFGITDRRHAFREAKYEEAQMKWRRRAVRFSTDYEGHVPTIFDKISVSHQMPDWGQSGDLVGYNAGTFLITCSENLTWETQGGELIDNWNFELNLDNWTSAGTQVTLARSADKASHGDYSAKLTKGTGGDNVLQLSDAGTYISDLTAGTEYTITADLACSATRIGYIVLSLSGGAHGTVERTTSGDALITAFTTITLTTTIDYSDRTLATILIGLKGGGGSADAQNGDILYVDNVHAYRSGSSVQHYVAFQKDDATLDGPHIATKVVGQAKQIQLAGALTFTPNTDAVGRERTKYKFGRSDKWHKDMIVTAIVPRENGRVELTLVNEDDRVHSADGATYVPPSDETTLNTIPDSPVVLWVVAEALGPLSNRRLRVMWSPAKGARYYVVEQSEGGIGDRRVEIEVSFIVNGPFTADEDIASFKTLLTLPSKVDLYDPGNPFLETDGVGIALVRVHTGVSHRLATDDWVFLAGFPSVAGIPASEINGARQIAVDSATEFHFSTTTGATAGISLPKRVAQTWTLRFDTTARGTASESTATGESVFDYVYVSGEEIGALEIVVGLTSQAYFIAGADSEVNSSWTRVGDGITISTHIEGQVVLSQVYPTTESIGVRVRGVGGLLGPWCYCTALAETVNILDTNLNVQMDGAVAPPANDLGIVLRKCSWIVADGTSPLTGSAISCGAHHRLKGIEIEIVEGFDQPGTIIVGNESDDDAYLTADFWASPDTIQVAGINQVSLMSAEGGQTGVGVSLGRYSSTAHSIDWELTATGTAPSAGKATITAIYEYVEPDPTL